MRRKLLLCIGLAACLTVAGPANPASADTGDTVNAAVTGTVNSNDPNCAGDIGTPGPPRPNGPRLDGIENPCTHDGSFSGVAIAGNFTIGDHLLGAPLHEWAGVTDDVDVLYTNTETAARGVGTIKTTSFTGTGLGAILPGVPAAGWRLCGWIIPESRSVRLGVAAVAGLHLKYIINNPAETNPESGFTCDQYLTAPPASVSPAAGPAGIGDVLAFAVVTAIPGAATTPNPPCTLGNPACALVAGTVHGF